MSAAKLCINCVHLLGKRMNTDGAGAWRCHHPSNILSSTTDLVTGNEKLVYACTDLYALRADGASCGTGGKLFERYEPPGYAVPDPVSGNMVVIRTKPAKQNLADLI